MPERDLRWELQRDENSQGDNLSTSSKNVREKREDIQMYSA